MLDKETKQAIKSMQRFVECKQDMSVVTANEMKIILQYIEQLETDKQKLIEKLEENNEKDKHTVQVFESMYRNTTEDFYKRSYRRTIDMANARRELRKEILSIVKGENQVTVK